MTAVLRRPLRYAGVLCSLLAAAAVPASLDAQTVSANSEVQTLAGRGDAGIADGPAASATFLLPVGIAVAKDGTIYVADQAAQRIRALAAGTVRTVAGSGEMGADKLSVRGGYRDGAAAQAQFSKPAGLAVGPDGALYIADSRNACIRKLDRGVVSTVVGKAGERGAVDGDATVARLKDPRALAFDRAGNLYVADYGAGLRKLGRDGRLTTIALRDTRTLGVAVDQTEAEGTVAVSVPDGVIVHRNAGADDVLPGGAVEGGRPFGHPDALAMIGRREVLFADDQSSNLHYLRLPAKPFVTSVYTRAIAGGELDRLTDNADFRDGTRADARFYAPAGIAMQGNVALIADAGNRKIRRVELPSTRVPELADDIAPVDAQHYEIAYVGSTAAFYDSLGDDSVCAQLEMQLNRANRLGRPARCHAIRVDGASPASLHDVIAANVLPRKMNLIVVLMDPDEIAKPPAPAQSFAASIGDVAARTKAQGTRLAIVWTCTAPQVTGAEYFHAGEVNAAARKLPIVEYNRRGSVVRPLQTTLRSLNIPEHDLFEDVVAFERSPQARPLFSTVGADSYPLAGSNALFAESIAQFLLRLPADQISAGSASSRKVST